MAIYWASNKVHLESILFRNKSLPESDALWNHRPLSIVSFRRVPVRACVRVCVCVCVVGESGLYNQLSAYQASLSI